MRSLAHEEEEEEEEERSTDGVLESFEHKF
jgi:hypothetical protein